MNKYWWNKVILLVPKEVVKNSSSSFTVMNIIWLDSTEHDNSSRIGSDDPIVLLYSLLHTDLHRGVTKMDLSSQCIWPIFVMVTTTHESRLYITSYQTMDAIDGKQARRTGSAGPLGQLFDHGCDSISTTFICMSIMASE